MIKLLLGLFTFKSLSLFAGDFIIKEKADEVYLRLVSDVNSQEILCNKLYAQKEQIEFYSEKTDTSFKSECYCRSNFCELEITSALPSRFLRSRKGISLSRLGPNCTSHVLYESGVSSYNRYATRNELGLLINSNNCRKLDDEEIAEPKDIIVWRSKTFFPSSKSPKEIYHTAVFISDKLIYTKNGIHNSFLEIVSYNKMLKPDYSYASLIYDKPIDRYRCSYENIHDIESLSRKRVYKLYYRAISELKKAKRKLNDSQYKRTSKWRLEKLKTHLLETKTSLERTIPKLITLFELEYSLSTFPTDAQTILKDNKVIAYFLDYIEEKYNLKNSNDLKNFYKSEFYSFYQKLDSIRIQKMWDN